MRPIYPRSIYLKPPVFAVSLPFVRSLEALLGLGTVSERMAYCHGRDFLFCSMCGTLLSFDSLEFARCRLCGFKRSAAEIVGRETRYTLTAEDIRRELKIEPFVLIDSAPIHEELVQRAVVNETCPQCHHPQLEYHTKQLRSADEGQTVFYECAQCGHKFSVNT